MTNKINKLKCLIRGRKSKSSFIVALLEVPSFPDESKLGDIVRTPLRSVIAATDDDKPRTFLLLDKEQKHCIGDELMRLDVKCGVWMWCKLYHVDNQEKENETS